MRGSWRPNRTATYWPPTLMAIRVVSFSFSRVAQPEAWGTSLLDAGFLYRILSPTGLQIQSGVPKALSAGWWLSLPHLVSNSSDLQLTDFLPSPSYIIVQSPTQYLPMDWPSEMCHFCCLWNGMFDCHRAEITVMQFTGHSVPVHQSMSVPWDFTLSHIVSQVRLRDFFS